MTLRFSLLAYGREVSFSIDHKTFEKRCVSKFHAQPRKMVNKSDNIDQWSSREMVFIITESSMCEGILCD
jgi:hypothetical protein